MPPKVWEKYVLVQTHKRRKWARCQVQCGFTVLLTEKRNLLHPFIKFVVVFFFESTSRRVLRCDQRDMSTSERGAAKRPATDVAGQEQPRKLVAHGHEREKTPSYDKFMQWCRSNGADVSGVIVRKGAHGTGLFATKFIPKGTPYCSIPASMQVTCSKALDSPIGKAILGSAAVTKPVSARSILYCFLISEANNSGGHWYPWLSACPSTYTDPLWWGEEPGSGAPLAQKLLSGTQAGYDFDFHKQCLLDMIEGLNLAALNSADPQMFPLELFTYERFLWARSFFASRCYHIDALCQQLSPNGSGSPVKELVREH